MVDLKYIEAKKEIWIIKGFFYIDSNSKKKQTISPFKTKVHNAL